MTEDVFVDVGVEWRLLNKLLDPKNRDYINRFSPALFTGNRADVFASMQHCFVEYGTITFDGVHKYLKGKVPGELTAANAGDLTTLIDQSARLAKKRQLKRTAAILELLAKEYDPSEDSIRQAIEFEPIMADQDSSLALGAMSFLGDLHAKMKGDYTFAKTGFKSCDRMMGGEWKPKSFVVIAGGVGSGKTTFWINSQKRMAQGYANKKTGEKIITPSLFISLEMSRADLMLKLIADELNIDAADILSANFAAYDDYASEADLIKTIEDKTVELQQLPMYIIDNGSLNLAQIVYEIRKHVHKHNVRVVCLDYLQLINHRPTGNANADLGEISRVLKDLAKRENITIIVLSQINRAGEGYDAIRDSGEVQAVADVIAQLIPDTDDGFSNTGVIGINLAWWKNRFGPAGRKTPLLLYGAYQRFMDGISDEKNKEERNYN